MLVQNLKKIESIVVLSHYCGLYTPSDDDLDEELSGGSGILRDLLVQLMAQWKFGKLTSLDEDDVDLVKNKSASLNLKTLRRIFHNLIVGLPAGTPLFIIIDNINYYETSELRRETKKAIREINQLLSVRKVKALVKIFVTAANRAFEIGDCFQDEDKIVVPAHPSGDKMGFADKRFELDFGTQIANLKRSSQQLDKPK
ncbi:uncharacterized protein TRUGW13939_01211 [Talaromyces rugulosus]|uniref:Uncharacterized protein n=1 Tax=Talaromyces rugulosus TaxID=121627 RepID=A0A7H8QJK0_TALRU|nr:uncharacterized protein TRUGW13939_01211 [Talaromyces rugulosus]QKX54127.1 hypothetical protein TRUGW13939_01211 [Talaromyces rugulosus]